MPEVRLTHPEKVLFGNDGDPITKGDLADYYVGVAEWLLPHVEDRPLSLQVFPGGIGRPGHFMKNVPGYFPDWIRRVELEKRGGTTTYPVATTADSLRMLAQHNALTLHVPTARLDRPERPDKLIVDFDPSGGDDVFDDVVAGARLAAELLRDAGLEPFTMTTGSRGLHVVAPLRRESDYGDVLAMGKALAAAITAADERFTTEFLKENRDERVFVDVLRNRPAQTAVAPYSVRAKPGAPVATPLRWDELDGLRDARAWTLRTIPQRLQERGDPWAEISAAAASPRSAARKLEAAAPAG